MQIRPGSMYPLGATYDGAGVNFALFSEVAKHVELCLFDEQDNETRIDMTEQNSYVWHTYNLEYSQGRDTVIVCMDRMIQIMDYGVIQTNFFWTLMQRQ